MRTSKKKVNKGAVPELKLPMVEARQKKQELWERMIQLQNAVVRLTNRQEGILNI